ncbi:hypothetical protein CE11_00722 [Megavirus courdo11]|uniref:Uncharacterized protein n=4 Tax=Megavirus TaxID=3044761 RepID=L7Y6I3_9VIRU|nr:hypothetical protein c7_L791 [Megavirus courdo7]AFX92748.1 hypothetical protein CE11_00722 [Megavirus courdo11]AGD92608.1 hypothetical protein LBA_00690 [Megavirus lba]AUV58612.1 hypothetical protein [Bandra megavirus]AVL93979.1 hypothetical protein mvi_619 [Megavirus vitis]
MLIYTYKLEKYVRTKIFPKILLIPDKNRYIIKGSFRRRVPFVTDIDVVNNVYPEISRENIYDEIIKLVNNIQSDPNIILAYLSCGTDERFKISTGSSKELSNIQSLLPDNEKNEFQLVLNKYYNDQQKKLFYLNELIWDHYKLRWKPEDVLIGSMNLANNVSVNFRETVENNSTILLQYYVKLGSYPVGIDVVINYQKIDLTPAYKNAALYQLQLANYSREYYYMLFPLRYYFKNNQDISQQLENIIEKKYGLYKQLMVRIDDYHTLYKSGNLKIDMATNIVIGILRDIEKLPGFESDTIYQIKKVATNNSPSIKIEEWDILLKVLYQEINTAVNNKSRKYFYRYIAMVPPQDRSKNYISENQDMRLKMVN